MLACEISIELCYELSIVSATRITVLVLLLVLRGLGGLGLDALYWNFTLAIKRKKSKLQYAEGKELSRVDRSIYSRLICLLVKGSGAQFKCCCRRVSSTSVASID